MLIVAYLFFVGLNIVEAIRNKNNRIIVLLSVLFIILLVGGNSYNVDYPGYEYYYNQHINSTFEPGYLLFASFSRRFGLSYVYFNLLLVTFSVIIYTFVVKKLNGPFSFVIALYLLTMSFLDAVQIRQFLCYSLFTLAIYYLSRNNSIGFFAAMIAAASFQLSALLYLPLFFIKNKNTEDNRMMLLFFLFILIICLGVFANGNSISFLKSIMSHFLAKEKLVYFDSHTNWGFILTFSFQFMCVYISTIIDHYLVGINDPDIFSFSGIVRKSVYYSSIALPLVMINNNFMRFFKFSLLGLFILSSYVLSKLRSSEKQQILIFPGTSGDRQLFILLIFILFATYAVSIQVSSEVFNVLTYNLFL